MKKIPYRGQELFSPKLDVVFKEIFSKEENKELLRSFLNNFLDLRIDENDNIILTNTELTNELAEDKESRLDLRVARYDDDNKLQEQIDVEIQLSNRGDMIKRSVYYLSKMFAGQLKTSEPYAKLGRVITLNIIDFTLFSDDELIHTARLQDVKTHVQLTDCIEVNFVELPKQKQFHTSSLTEREQWLLFLTAEKEEDLNMLINQGKMMQKAVYNLQQLSADVNMQYRYEMREKAINDYNNDILCATEEGLQMGLQQGRQEGMQAQTFAIAKSMKMRQMPICDIMDITGLSSHEIASL